MRSLKAKDSSNSAAVSDIGSPVDPTDPEHQAQRQGAGRTWTRRSALLEPSVGRFWMVFPDQVLVLSLLPRPQDHGVVDRSRCRLHRRARRDLRRPDFPPRQRRQHLGLWRPDRRDLRQLRRRDQAALSRRQEARPQEDLPGFDATVSGTWEVAGLLRFQQPRRRGDHRHHSQPTWNIGAHELQGYDSHFSLRFYNNDAMPATISNCAVHYEMADAEA